MNIDDPTGSTSLSAPRLRLQMEGAEPCLLELKAGRNTLGQAEDNDFQVAHASVSDHHCEIEVAAATIVVRDLGSAQGTFLDGEPVQQAVLRPAQTLRIGEVPFVLDHEVPGSSEPPIPTPPDVARPAARPAGRECSQHPEARATWVCTECERQWCAACIKQINLAPQRTVTVCPVCKGLCERLSGRTAVSNLPGSFGAGLLNALGYPFKGSGPLLLIGMAILQFVFGMVRSNQPTGAAAGRLPNATTVIIGAGSGASWLIGAAVSAYILLFLRRVLVVSTDGAEQMPDWPQFDIESLREALSEFMVVSLVTLGPGLFCSYFVGPESQAFKFGCYALIGLGAIYFPLALLAVIIYDDLAAVNPLLAIVSILRAPVAYLSFLLFAGATLGAAYGVQWGLENMRAPILAATIGGVALLYAIIAGLRALGWFYYFTKDDLDWS